MALLDVSIIEEVRDALGDAAYMGYATRMLNEMRALSPTMKAQLDGDRAVLADAAHRAAGSAVSVGASGLHARLKAIEDAARSGDAALARLVAGFDAEVEATEAAIGALVGA